MRTEKSGRYQVPMKEKAPPSQWFCHQKDEAHARVTTFCSQTACTACLTERHILSHLWLFCMVSITFRHDNGRRLRHSLLMSRSLKQNKNRIDSLLFFCSRPRSVWSSRMYSHAVSPRASHLPATFCAGIPDGTSSSHCLTDFHFSDLWSQILSDSYPVWFLSNLISTQFDSYPIWLLSHSHAPKILRSRLHYSLFPGCLSSPLPNAI